MKISDYYTPTPRQAFAHREASKHRYCLYGGSVGSGKTMWLVMEVIYQCLRYPESRVLLARAYLTSLEKTTLLTLEECLNSPKIKKEVKKHNKWKKFIQFKNGSVIYYLPLADDSKSLDKIKSMEISMFAVDEADQLSEKAFSILITRLRQTIPNKYRLKMKRRGVLTSNPSSGWIRKRFVEDDLEDHCFIQALPSQNPHLPADYIPTLIRDLSPEEKSALVDGNWYAVKSPDAVFTFEEVDEALKRDKIPGEVSLGVDVARFGDDESVICLREGNSFSFPYINKNADTQDLVRKIVKMVGNNDYPVFCDGAGIGGGVVDQLKAKGINVVEVYGSDRAKNSRQFLNIKAENFFRVKDKIREIRLPKDKVLKDQMLQVRFSETSGERIKIESQAEQRRKGIPSMDRLDALVLACMGFDKQEELIPDKRRELQGMREFQGDIPSVRYYQDWDKILKKAEKDMNEALERRKRGRK